jgi:hypothetical protein
VAEPVNYLIAKRRQAGQPAAFLPPGFAIAASHALLAAKRRDPWIGPPVSVRPNPWIGPPVQVGPQPQVIGPVAGSAWGAETQPRVSNWSICRKIE